MTSSDSPASKKLRTEGGSAGSASGSGSSSAPFPLYVDGRSAGVNLVFIAVVPPNTTEGVEGEKGSSSSSKATIIEAVKAATISAGADSSAVVLAVSVASVTSTMQQLNGVMGTATTSSGSSATAVVKAIGAATNGLVDSSFFALTTADGAGEGDERIYGSLNAVPIIVAVCEECGEDDNNDEKSSAQSVLDGLEGLGDMSRYLAVYFDDGIASTLTPEEAKDKASEPQPSLTVANMPCAVMYTASPSSSSSSSPSSALTRVVQKIKIAGPGPLHSMALLTPTHTKAHLVREAVRSAAMRSSSSLAYTSASRVSGEQSLAQYAGGNGGAYNTAKAALSVADAASSLSSSSPSPSYTVVYAGASWCPPCMRIIKELPAMLSGMRSAADGGEPTNTNAPTTAPFAPSLDADSIMGAASVEADVPIATTAAMLKADYDTSPSILGLFGIKTIPMFVVLDNKKVAEGLLAAASSSSSAAALSEEAAGAILKGALVGEPLQNSQRPIVGAYLQKTCAAPLCFTMDDDF